MEKYRKHLLRLKAQGKRKLQKAIGINRIEAYDGQFVTFKFNDCVSY